MPADTPPLTAKLLLQAYANGYFPMGQTRSSSDIGWYNPEKRGILPLESFHVPRKLAAFLRTSPFTFTTNQCFPEVIRACADTRPKHEDTWINPTIIDLYTELWNMGYAHSVECWQETAGHKQLAGGLYGVSLGGAFCGESMFSRSPNASKAALVHLVTLLREAGYTLLDTQYVNDHLIQFGVQEIPRDLYLKKLDTALDIRPKSCFSTHP